jgi:hypothetical protein
MARMVLVALTFACGCFISGPAAFAAESTPPARETAFPAANGALDTTPSSSTKARLIITEETEVLLDGRPCRYQQVPSNATITFVEVGSDRQTVLRIHFRSPK